MRASIGEIRRRTTVAKDQAEQGVDWRADREFTAFCAQLGVELTPAQRAFCLVAYDGHEPRDLPDDLRDIARQLFGPIDIIPPAARRVVVVVAGARAGKSYVVAALRCLHLALTVSLAPLAPGEEAVAAIIAPDPRQRRQCFNYAKGAVERHPQIARMLDGTPGKDQLALRRDGHLVIIESVPAKRGGSAGRGRSLVCAVLEEAAFFLDENHVVNDVEVFKAVMPRVLLGGQTIISSTPWAEAGLLYEEFVANHPKPQVAAQNCRTPGRPHRAIAAHAPTLLFRNNELTREIVAAEEQRDPTNAQREYGAQFLTVGVSLFFDAGAIAQAASYPRPTELPPMRLDTAAAGADFGFVTDSSALAIAENDGALVHVSAVLELRPERLTALKPSIVAARFAARTREYGCAGIVADGHYREAMREHLATHDIAFVSAPEGASGKLDTYTVVRTLLHEGRVRLPNDPRLLQQLREVTSRPTPGGGLQISSPRKAGHGDLVSALVLAVYTASKLAPDAPERHVIQDPDERAEIELFEREQARDFWDRALDRRLH